MHGLIVAFYHDLEVMIPRKTLDTEAHITLSAFCRNFCQICEVQQTLYLEKPISSHGFGDNLISKTSFLCPM